jgi:ABC-type amino acid transport substrate-binding protein
LKKALQGKLIGVQKGTTSESLLNDIRREAGTEAFKIEGFADSSLIFEALSERRIDYGVMDSSFATTGLMRYGTLHRSEFTPEDMPMGRQSVEKYALAVKSSEKELLEYINLILGELRDTKQIDELFRSAANDFIKTVIKGEIRGVNHDYPLLPSSCEEISRTP